MDEKEIEYFLDQCEEEKKLDPDFETLIKIIYNYGGFLVVYFSDLVNIKDEQCLYDKRQRIYIDYSEIKELI